MAKKSAARRAINQFNGKTVDGRDIEVEEAHSRRPRQQGVPLYEKPQAPTLAALINHTAPLSEEIRAARSTRHAGLMLRANNQYLR